MTIFFICLIFFVSPSSCQDLTWMWRDGNPSANEAMTGELPGGRSGAAVWTQRDKASVWIFGGQTHHDGGQPKLLNDLWRYDRGGKWTLVDDGHGNWSVSVPEPRHMSSGCGIQGVYFIVSGGLGDSGQGLDDTWVYYIPESKWLMLSEVQDKFGAHTDVPVVHPSARGDVASWCLETEFLVYGGADGNKNLLYDLWSFDMEQLVWWEKQSSARLPKNKEFVAHLNYPAARSGATTWLTRNNRMLMFGGNIDVNNVEAKHLLIGYSSDMWEYIFPEDRWQFIAGNTQVCAGPGVYGTLGQYIHKSPAMPGCRRKAAAWTDRRNNLWMFGGDGIDNDPASFSVFQPSKLLSDLWFFNIDKRHWIWKGGETKGDKGGNFGEKGHADNSHLPGSRCESIVFESWERFYLYGGIGHDGNGKDGYLNDLWELNVELDPAVKLNAPYSGPVFGLIFMMLSLVVVVTVLFFCSRRNSKGVQVSKHSVEYSRLMTDQA